MFNSGWEDQGFLVHFTHAVGEGLPVGGVAERLRPRLRAAAQQLADGALLLSVRELAPLHGVLRGARTSAGFRQMTFTGFLGQLRAANRPGSLRHGDDRPQHRAGGRLGERLPRQGQRRAAGRTVRASSSAWTSTAATTSRRSTSSRRSIWPARSRGTRPTSRSTMRGASIPASTCRRSRRSADVRASRAASAAITSPRRTSAGSSAIARRRMPPRPVSAPSRSARSRAQRHRAGVARLPRSGAVRPLFPRAVGTRLHHRQSRPRARDQPAVRPGDALHDGAHAVGVSTSISTASTISSSAIRRRPISSSSAIAAARACAASRSRRARTSGRGYSIEVGAQISRGRALDDDANLDDISPVTFSVLGRKEFGDRVYAQARLACVRQGRSSGPERDRGARRDAPRCRRRLADPAAARAARPAPQPAGR